MAAQISYEISMKNLNAGLEGRDITAIVAFCKASDSVFQRMQQQIKALSSDSSTVSTEASHTHYNERKLQQYTSCLKLVKNHFNECLSRNTSLGFARQSIPKLLDHLSRNVKRVITSLQQVQISGLSNRDMERQTDHLLTLMTDTVMDLKSIMAVLGRASVERRGSDASMTSVTSERSDSLQEAEMGAAQRQLLKVWGTLDQRAVIVEGILNGEIPLLLQYLGQRYDPEIADWMNVINTGLVETLIFMKEKEIGYAKKMIKNMGFDPNTKLRQICLYTLDKSLRDYLISELGKMEILTHEENDMIEFIRKLEILYPCTSYDMAKSLQMRETSSAVDLNLNPVDPEAELDLSKYCGELEAPSENSVQGVESRGYSHTMLEWVRSFDTEVKADIILAHAFGSKDTNLSMVERIPTQVVWRYLGVHQEFKVIETWIRHQFPLSTVDESSVTHSWPFNLKITQDMLDSTPGATQRTRELILDEFARRGQFTTEEVSDFEMILLRIFNTQSLFRMPHRLEAAKVKPSFGLDEFHQQMIRYCIAKELPQLLYFYLDFWSVRLEQYLLDSKDKQEIPSWVHVIQSFRNATENVLDPERVFQASLSCSHIVHDLRSANIESLLDEGLIITALGTLMYSPERFHQFLADPPESTMVMLNQMNCPTLCDVMQGNKQNAPRNMFTTVYQLMQGNIMFDPNNLFGWQEAHTTACEDAVKELPYFSQRHLVNRYGYKESLQWMYYLKQGRPSFAFCRLLIDEDLLGNSVEMQPKLLRRICMKIHWLGVKYFYQCHVTAACAAMMEMLGQDSTCFRVHVHSAQLIAEHHGTKLKGSLEERKQIKAVVNKELALKLQQCLHMKVGVIEEVFYLLEQAIGDVFKNHPHINRTDATAEMKWLVLYAFCKCHQLQFSTRFLEHCTEGNDWLTFLVHAQNYQFPLQQVQRLVKQFKDPILREHMRNVMNVMMEKSKKNADCQENPTSSVKKIRAKLYAIVGVARDNSSTDDEARTEEPKIDKPEDPPHRLSKTEVCVDLLAKTTESANLLDLVRECEKTQQPARQLCAYAFQTRNPVLAVISACYKDHDALTCLCSWLCASLSLGHDEVIHNIMNKAKCTLQDVCYLWQASNTMDNIPLLHNAFYLFFPKSVMLPFLDFIAKLNCFDEVTTLRNILTQFRGAWNSLINDGRGLDCGIFDINWLEARIFDTIYYILCYTPHASQLLKHLDQSNLLLDVGKNQETVPNVALLHQLSLLVREEFIVINFGQLLIENSEEFQAEWDRVIRCLEERGCWNKARVAKETLKLPTTNITVNQLNNELDALIETGTWQCEEVQIEFWSRVEKLFSQEETDYVQAARFFKEHAERCGSATERHRMYALAYKWLEKSDLGSDTDEKTNLLTHIWRSKIHAHIQKRRNEVNRPSVSAEEDSPSTAQFVPFDKTQLRKLYPASQAPRIEEELSAEELAGLESLLNQMVDAGHLLEAMRIATHFGHPDQDLNIILTCHRLASGEIHPDGLDASSRKIMEGPVTRRPRTSSLHIVTLPRIGSSLSISSRLQEAGDVLMQEEDHVVQCIDLFTHQCVHSRQGCQLILATYQIAKLLTIDYKEAIAIDEFKLLGHVISSELSTRYLLAKSFIQSAALVDSQVAGYLCDLVIESLELHLGISGVEKPVSGKSNSSAANAPRRLIISDLVQLCEDPSLLGQRLLQAMRSSQASNVHPSLQTLQLEVELIVYAHDCFTLSCNMEGISELLGICRSVTERLHEAGQYTTLVRLLTGVGRYSEMTYIFDILKTQHQFELLFRKRMEKEDKLKLAILDYLERYHQEDTETYTMVALHFTMYRQIASMLQSSARQLLSQLTQLENTSEVNKKLQKILHYLSDAAESYVKEGCMRQAEDCVREAKLVALQIQLLPSKLCVVNLDQASLINLLPQLSKIHHVYIVIEAYSESRLWAVVYHHHLIKKGDFKLLKELSVYYKLTPSLVSDIADRFESSQSQATKQQLANFQKMLGLCSDIKLANSLAIRFGLTEFSHHLTKGDGGAYLQDIGMLRK